jgi:hypothetical protein
MPEVVKPTAHACGGSGRRPGGLPAEDRLLGIGVVRDRDLIVSEKIVDFANAPLHTRRWLLSSWQCFIAAIVACGLGLCFITLAGGAAVYGADAIGPWSGGMYYWAEWSWLSIFLGGGLFVAGLIALILAAANSIRQRPPSAK